MSNTTIIFVFLFAKNILCVCVCVCMYVCLEVGVLGQPRETWISWISWKGFSNISDYAKSDDGADY